MAAKKLCFVIGPIGKHKSEVRAEADRLLKDIIKPTFRTNFKDFKVVRADEMAQPGMIDSQVISAVIDADIVIADLSNQNANAFYELGIRHVLQKPIIHMFRRNELPPADIAAYRGIEFDLVEKEDITAAKSNLRKAVVETLNTDFQIDNPVTRAKSMTKLLERREGQVDAVLGAAVNAFSPIAHLTGMLSSLSHYQDTPISADSYESMLADLTKAKKLRDELFLAIEALKIFR